MLAELKALDYKNVLHYFSVFSAIPHGSGNVGQIADYLEATIAFLDNSRLSRHLEDRRLCRTVLLNTVQRIANLAVWLETLYRDSTACYVRESLGLTLEWKVQTVHSGVELLKNDAENK